MSHINKPHSPYSPHFQAGKNEVNEVVFVAHDFCY